MQEGTVVEDVANPSPENSIDATSSPHNATAEGIRASPIEPEISLVTESIEKERTQQPVQELFPEPEPQPETNLEPLPLSDSKAQPAQITPPQQPTNPFLIPRPKTVTPSPAQTLFGPRIVEPAVPAAAYSQEEPELPPTPTQRGLSDPVVTTPPSGIHNTPSKRARRRKSPGAGLKSSPLKPQAQRPEDPIDESVLMPPPPPELKAGNLSKRRRSARFLPPADPNATKRKERDDLLKELQQLKADVSLTNQENERIRKAFESGRSGSSTSKDTQELLDVLLRSMATEAPTLPEPKPISSLPNVQLFLPFSSKRKAQTSNSPVLEKPLPSYLPVPLDDPLPYLQVFAPLSYTSNISILPNMPTSSSSDDSSFLEVPPLQRHHITARSQSGLFAAKLAMTVNMSNLSVASIDIEKLDRNAEAELGAFMRKRLSDRDEDIEYTLGKDITVLCWAMGRWAEVSVLRARLWCAIELELGTPEARKDTIQKASRKRKRKRAVAVDEEVAADLADMADENGHQKWTRRQLLPHMGRTALEISDEAYHVEIRFEWRMDFDWTGEIESIISASARIPKHWQQEDDRRSLTKIPETFNRMVLDMGPLGAARALVGLLMPS
ncbi:hypothetical protein PVAG01_03704 [Phlyctema vagabunda]|uniref:Uncharacterized protein n=1 Tax=Phlyctema vagabunda TaxID=108571 RepID=A0ABR4PM79_9HELO